jgi:hypothetical protein
MTTATVNSTVQLDDGRKFSGQIFSITGTRLGRDIDHNSFVAHLELASSGRGTALAPMLSNLDRSDARVQEHITRILETVGVEYWDQLVGRSVIALYDWQSTTGVIKGLASLDGSRVYLIADTFLEA